MVFSSLTFLFYYLPICIGVYFLVPPKAKNLVLFVSGLLFYAWGEPVYVLFMLLCILVNFGAGLLMQKFDVYARKRKMVMLFSVVFSLGLLGVCKYAGFFCELVGISIKTISLPIGISFYTFQSMSYTIDLYRRKISVQKSLVNFGAYVAMFPQIIAGPIVRYADVEAALSKRKVTLAGIGEGAGIFIAGLAKKVLLANNIGQLWTEIKASDYGELSVLGAWLGILAFTFQIYFDFSGYSDMAVGLGRMFGFHFPENFSYPYLARSISDFWRRWHITLSTWFREYVYIPLGGNRHGQWRTIRNLLIVWTLTGFWHGASWNFLLWGLYFGVLIVIERLWLGEKLKKLPTPLSMLYTFLLVVFGWILFDTNTLCDAGRYFIAMFGANGALFDNTAMYQLTSYWAIFVLCILGATRLFHHLTVKYSHSRRYAGVFYTLAPLVQLAVFLLCIAYLVTETYNPFLYFRF